MQLHKDCTGTILWILGCCAALIVLVILCINNLVIEIALCTFLVLFMIFGVWFHRLPERERKGGDNRISAVADGKVLKISQVYEKEYLKRDCIKISVFMSFFDVHSNFFPMDGDISYYKYHDGKYLMAFLPKSSEKNEHSSTAIRNEHGEILFKQIAGTFARRIVCYSEEGKQVKAGEDCGIIKFGSRIDYFLPLDADIKVKIGDRTVASETIIAELR